MPPYGEPDWATPGDTTNNTTTINNNATFAPTTGGGGGGTNANSANDRNNARCVIYGLSLFNMGLAAMMGALGILSLVRYNPSSFDDLTLAFLSVYMAIFAVLLFLYELIWWQPMAALNYTFRKNFGFLYGLKGKGLYLIFIAFLTLGLLEDNASGVAGLDWATGVGWLAGGVLHLFVACTMPEVTAAYKPPTAGLSQMGGATDETNTKNDNSPA